MTTCNWMVILKAITQKAVDFLVFYSAQLAKNRKNIYIFLKKLKKARF